MPDQKGLLFRSEGLQPDVAHIPERGHAPSRPISCSCRRSDGVKLNVLASLRKLLQPIGHIVIGLGGMETHPGHTGGSRDRVRVVRLMHMPEETELNGFHREVSCRLVGSMS